MQLNGRKEHSQETANDRSRRVPHSSLRVHCNSMAWTRAQAARVLPLLQFMSFGFLLLSSFRPASAWCIGGRCVAGSRGRSPAACDVARKDRRGLISILHGLQPPGAGFFRRMPSAGVRSTGDGMDAGEAGGEELRLPPQFSQRRGWPGASSGKYFMQMHVSSDLSQIKCGGTTTIALAICNSNTNHAYGVYNSDHHVMFFCRAWQ